MSIHCNFCENACENFEVRRLICCDNRDSESTFFARCCCRQDQRKDIQWSKIFETLSGAESFSVIYTPYVETEQFIDLTDLPFYTTTVFFQDHLGELRVLSHHRPHDYKYRVTKKERFEFIAELEREHHEDCKEHDSRPFEDVLEDLMSPRDHDRIVSLTEDTNQPPLSRPTSENVESKEHKFQATENCNVFEGALVADILPPHLLEPITRFMFDTLDNTYYQMHAMFSGNPKMIRTLPVKDCHGQVVFGIMIIGPNAVPYDQKLQRYVGDGEEEGPPQQSMNSMTKTHTDGEVYTEGTTNFRRMGLNTMKKWRANRRKTVKNM
jgi:hypothetical protein